MMSAMARAHPATTPWQRLAALMVLVLATAGLQRAHGQEPVDAGEALAEVEIIVFRLLDQTGGSQEWEAPAPVTAAPASPAVSTESQYPPLSPEALRLGGTAARLRGSARYRLLYHGGWIQNVGPQARTLPGALPSAVRQQGLEGTVTVYRERYLHALLDLQLTAIDAPAPWRLRQSRRLKASAIHYFDHPRFGVILTVRGRDGPAATP
jgi:hypothetical protein